MFYLFGGQNEPEKLTADASKTRQGGEENGSGGEEKGEEGGVNNGRQLTNGVGFSLGVSFSRKFIRG